MSSRIRTMSVDNPDFPFEPPIYEGDHDSAHDKLVPGRLRRMGHGHRKTPGWSARRGGRGSAWARPATIAWPPCTRRRWSQPRHRVRNRGCGEPQSGETGPNARSAGPARPAGWSRDGRGDGPATTRVGVKSPPHAMKATVILRPTMSAGSYRHGRECRSAQVRRSHVDLHCFRSGSCAAVGESSVSSLPCGKESRRPASPWSKCHASFMHLISPQQAVEHHPESTTCSRTDLRNQCLPKTSKQPKIKSQGCPGSVRSHG
jgi:hypothetical protein